MRRRDVLDVLTLAALLMIALVASACSSAIVPTPYPTFTPYPTNTPYPTATLPPPTDTPEPTATPAPEAATAGLSVQPDLATFQMYFSELGIGRLPAGKELPAGLEQQVSVFAPGDQLCQYGTLVKEAQPAMEYYDVQARKPTGPRLKFPRSLLPGGFASCGPVVLAAREYELRLYVGEILVAVIPFRVQ